MDWTRKLTGFVRDLGFYLHKRKNPYIRRFFHERVRSFFYRRIDYCLMARPINSPIPARPNPVGVEIRPGVVEDIDRFAKKIFPSEIDRYRRRLRNGRKFFVTMLEGRWINHAWITQRLSFAIDNIDLDLKEGDIYIDDAYTVPELRGRGINTLLHHYILEECRKRGFRRALIIVDVKNTASMRAMEKCDFASIGRFVYRRFLLSRRLIFRKDPSNQGISS